MKQFDIPVVMILFKRKETSLTILNRIAQVRPRKLYLMSDEGRNDDEKKLVAECRRAIEENISWDCEVIRHYASENRGVYANIGLGAKWVFEREDKAIFLEDDNLPEVTFFEYCRELLRLYEHDTRVLWICGTNYLGQYHPKSGDSYMFTKHLLPCGWASWAEKFNRFYDGELTLAEDDTIIERVRYSYTSKSLFQQQIDAVRKEMRRKNRGERFGSWDYQMAFSIRANSMYGISPSLNQVRNIGVDSFSEHGGVSFRSVMTRRFCGMNSYPLEFPLKHPKTVLPDNVYEKKIEKVILLPLSKRILRGLKKIVVWVFGIDPDISFAAILKGRKRSI